MEVDKLELLEDKRFYVYAYLDPRKSGKYEYDIYNFCFEPFYIGKGHAYRKFEHIYDSKSSKRNNPKLNKIRRLEKLGLSPQIVDVIVNVVEKKANEMECALISLIGRKDLKKGPLLNLTDGGEGISGVIRSDDYRKKMSRLHKNKILSRETRRKISISKKGKKLLKSTIDKIRKANTGKKRSIRAKENMSNAVKASYKKNLGRSKAVGDFHRGKVLSLETKEKIREKRKIQVMKPISEETRLKMSEAAKSRKAISIETRIKMSEAHKGKKLSEDTKRKMSVAQRKRWGC